MASLSLNLRLHFIADRNLIPCNAFEKTVRSALDGGCTILQLRAKNMSSQHIIKDAVMMWRWAEPYGIPVVINDHPELVHLTNAAGAHVGQHDMPWQQARQYLTGNRMLGLSIDSQAYWLDAKDADVDYFGVGPVFATCSKEDAAHPLGLNGLRFIAQQANRPIIGIGGICPDNAIRVLEAGADGLAILSSIALASCPLQKTRLYRDILDQWFLTQDKRPTENVLETESNHFICRQVRAIEDS